MKKHVNYKRLIRLFIIIQLFVVFASCKNDNKTSINNLSDIVTATSTENISIDTDTESLAIEDSEDEDNIPNLPASASSFEKFIPSDWEVSEYCEFDFNNDDYVDYIAVINNIHEKEYVGDRGYNNIVYPRILFIAFSNGENQYDLVYQDRDILDLDLHGLTCCGYNIPKIECSANSFVLTNFYGNSASASYKCDIFYFTYNNEKWQISKRVEKFIRTAFLDDEEVDVNINGIVEVETDYKNNIIKHKDILIKDTNENEEPEEYVFEYEFLFNDSDISTGFGADFLTEFENGMYKYYIDMDSNEFNENSEILPSISIKRLNKTTNDLENVFEYSTDKGDESFTSYKSNDFLTLGFVYLEDNKMVVRVQDKFEGKKKMYYINLVDSKVEYVGYSYDYWL